MCEYLALTFPSGKSSRASFVFVGPRFFDVSRDPNKVKQQENITEKVMAAELNQFGQKKCKNVLVSVGWGWGRGGGGG